MFRFEIVFGSDRRFPPNRFASDRGQDDARAFQVFWFIAVERSRLYYTNCVNCLCVTQSRNAQPKTCFSKFFRYVLQVNVKKVSGAAALRITSSIVIKQYCDARFLCGAPKWNVRGCFVYSIVVPSRYNGSLQPIRLVTDHLTERLNLDGACVLPPAHSGFEPKPSKPTKKNRSTTGQNIRLGAKKTNQNDVTTMSNNLMFRSMFFMNEEARHFLAPPIQLSTTDGEYFTRKTGNPNLNTHHQQQQQQQAVAALVNHDSSSSVDNKVLQVNYLPYNFIY